MDNSDKIRKWLAEELSDSERREFERSEEYTSISRMLDSLDHFAAPDYNQEEAYRRLSARTFANRTKLGLYRKLSPVLKVAAVFVFVLLTAYFALTEIFQSVDNEGWIADVSELYLPDSSFVALNMDSKIRISGSDWHNERRVELKGEAFFQVRKGSKFSVITEQGTVVVLGTEFSVKARGGFYDVSCYSGSVKVDTDYGTTVLNANSAFRILNQKTENYTLVNKPEPGWLHGESNFKSVPVKHVVEEMERQYQVSVKTQNVDLDRLFSGSFSNRDLILALESVTLPLDLNYTINENKTVITLEGK